MWIAVVLNANERRVLCCHVLIHTFHFRRSHTLTASNPTNEKKEEKNSITQQTKEWTSSGRVVVVIVWLALMRMQRGKGKMSNVRLSHVSVYVSVLVRMSRQWSICNNVYSMVSRTREWRRWQKERPTCTHAHAHTNTNKNKHSTHAIYETIKADHHMRTPIIDNSLCNGKTSATTRRAVDARDWPRRPASSSNRFAWKFAKFLWDFFPFVPYVALFCVKFVFFLRWIPNLIRVNIVFGSFQNEFFFSFAWKKLCHAHIEVSANLQMTETKMPNQKHKEHFNIFISLARDACQFECDNIIIPCACVCMYLGVWLCQWLSHCHVGEAP